MASVMASRLLCIPFDVSFFPGSLLLFLGLEGNVIQELACINVATVSVTAIIISVTTALGGALADSQAHSLNKRPQEGELVQDPQLPVGEELDCLARLFPCELGVVVALGVHPFNQKSEGTSQLIGLHLDKVQLVVSALPAACTAIAEGLVLRHPQDNVFFLLKPEGLLLLILPWLLSGAVRTLSPSLLLALNVAGGVGYLSSSDTSSSSA